MSSNELFDAMLERPERWIVNKILSDCIPEDLKNIVLLAFGARMGEIKEQIRFAMSYGMGESKLSRLTMGRTEEEAKDILGTLKELRNFSLRR